MKCRFTETNNFIIVRQLINLRLDMCAFLLKESSSVRTFCLQCLISTTETPQNS